ncbi:MBL fold metallo-hydrolase [Lactococcus garvieae]|jgi:glyoxylase-like metal-dependent hydrolase (beta-lactamase superfamily II)|uniref:MBL fold metallo-hydrolase n=1 Tax=Lactococcus garvieae TaxID=1363 RepID=A0AAX3NBR6_9LACT|nr:MBL fold metallo-hydrolase [Lactococcus garvieae]NHI70227.1 MBL fold metallo-hydrolase [Lactococcus garvieae]NHJ07046.1 MBL fold metallo-hydrolase [Lactococcus garvieae]WEA14017.1 MBL fold metallo-hydrolase [Lactococcus garvieae]
MKIEKIVSEIAQENAYILSNSAFSLLIDPGSQPEKIIAKLQEIGKPLNAILLTHAHFDHIMGLDTLKQAYPNAQVYLHENEKEWLKKPELNASALMLPFPVTCKTNIDEYYVCDTPYNFSGLKFHVRHTPGHSTGGISLVFEEEGLVFTGDALFAGAIGRTDLPTGNYAQLLQSIEAELFSLPDDYTVYPGHGPRTTIGKEKLYNPFF